MGSWCQDAIRAREIHIAFDAKAKFDAMGI
jgi:hypothetical protein